MAGPAGARRRSRPAGDVGGRAVLEVAVAVARGAPGAVPGRIDAAGLRERAKHHLDGAVRVGGAGGDDVALAAGRSGRERSGDQVALVGADAAGGGGGVALGVLGRRGGEIGVERGRDSRRVAMAGGAGQVRDVDLPVHVERGVDRRGGVAGVARAAVGALGVRGNRRNAVAGAAGGRGGAGPGRSVGPVPTSERPVAVDVGAGGAVPGGGGASRRGDGPERDLGRAVRVARARGDDVALGAGEGGAVLQVERVCAHGAGGRGRLALRALGGRGREAGVQRRVGPGRVPVAGGAGQVGDVDLAVHVRGQVDGGRGVAGVAAAAAGAVPTSGVRRRGRQAVAGSAGGRAGLGPHRGVGGIPAREAAMAVGGRAGGAVPEGNRAAGRGERSEGEVDLSVGVRCGRRDDVALGAGDRGADRAVLEVKLVGAYRPGGNVDLTIASFGGGSRERRVERGRLTSPVAVAERASFASADYPSVRPAGGRRTRVGATRKKCGGTCQNQGTNEYLGAC